MEWIFRNKIQEENDLRATAGYLQGSQEAWGVES